MVATIAGKDDPQMHSQYIHKCLPFRITTSIHATSLYCHRLIVTAASGTPLRDHKAPSRYATTRPTKLPPLDRINTATWIRAAARTHTACPDASINVGAVGHTTQARSIYLPNRNKRRDSSMRAVQGPVQRLPPGLDLVGDA